ncbi:MAG: hypothetical protein OYK82_06190 [Gammaproteobacteria bacterium]|nr:hypothetical protein [Gammaproteobacteria bacterium]
MVGLGVEGWLRSRAERSHGGARPILGSGAGYSGNSSSQAAQVPAIE